MAISELVGVYDANGGLLGEAAYVWGRLRGTTHCGLCDITHATVRRKAEWDRMAAGLPGSVVAFEAVVRARLAGGPG